MGLLHCYYHSYYYLPLYLSYESESRVLISDRQITLYVKCLYLPQYCLNF